MNVDCTRQVHILTLALNRTVPGYMTLGAVLETDILFPACITSFLDSLYIFSVSDMNPFSDRCSNLRSTLQIMLHWSYVVSFENIEVCAEFHEYVDHVYQIQLHGSEQWCLSVNILLVYVRSFLKKQTNDIHFFDGGRACMVQSSVADDIGQIGR